MRRKGKTGLEPGTKSFKCIKKRNPVKFSEGESSELEYMVFDDTPTGYILHLDQ